MPCAKTTNGHLTDECHVNCNEQRQSWLKSQSVRQAGRQATSYKGSAVPAGLAIAMEMAMVKAVPPCELLSAVQSDCNRQCGVFQNIVPVPAPFHIVLASTQAARRIMQCGNSSQVNARSVPWLEWEHQWLSRPTAPSRLPTGTWCEHSKVQFQGRGA